MKKFCVIGLGKFGSQVASVFYNEGHEVTGIDNNRDRVQKIKDQCSVAILGDATDKEFLAAQGVVEMDAVVVSTGDRSHLSTLITLHLKELGVTRIIVKAINDDHGRILRRVGADEVIHPEKDMALKVARSLSYPNILDFIPLTEDVSITEVAPPTAYLGKDLISLDLRRKYQITIIAIKDVISDKFDVSPHPEHVIKDSDLLVVLGRPEDVEMALKEGN
jgi:trk system potassium uptake protein TrkA